MRSRIPFLVAAGVLVCAAVVLVLRNVEVQVDDRDLDGSTGAVSCVIAPWDAVVNDERGGPGGEHDRSWGDAVGAACARANEQRGAVGGTSAFGGAALLLVAASGRRQRGRGLPPTS